VSATSTDVTEIIHLFKLYGKRRNKTAKQKAKDMNSADPTEEIGGAPLSGQDSMAVPEDTVDKEEAADIKRIVIYALNEIADLHERVKKCVPFSYFRCLFRLLL
jgi:hypothetical protein